MKEEANYGALYKKLDGILKKPLTIFVQGDTNGAVPNTSGMALKKLDVIPHSYNDGVSMGFKLI
jgi:hypothetical protein